MFVEESALFERGYWDERDDVRDEKSWEECKTLNSERADSDSVDQVS